MKLKTEYVIDGRVVTKETFQIAGYDVYVAMEDYGGEIKFYLIDEDGGVVDKFFVTADYGQGAGYIDSYGKD